ncbi:hypothetical protein QE152_g40996 [Popillia japonica]|uniref:Uncharacterized protein n=1 Tax=Popillia japonica TaxID=7064 RepID=A0AAW1HER9_POPJA
MAVPCLINSLFPDVRISGRFLRRRSSNSRTDGCLPHAGDYDQIVRIRENGERGRGVQIPGQTVACRMQEITIRLFAFARTASGDAELQLKSFALPAGCYCAAKIP